MISKQLERKVNLTPNELSSEVDHPIQLEYYLLESDVNDRNELAGKVVYGLEVTKRVSGNYYETEMVKNFSCCKDSVKELLGILAANTVTPVGLPFILDDIIGI